MLRTPPRATIHIQSSLGHRPQLQPGSTYLPGPGPAGAPLPPLPSPSSYLDLGLSASGASRPAASPATLTPASALGRGSHEVIPTLSQRLTSMPPLSKASPSTEEEMKASPVLRAFQFADKAGPGPRSSAHVVSPWVGWWPCGAGLPTHCATAPAIGEVPTGAVGWVAIRGGAWGGCTGALPVGLQPGLWWARSVTGPHSGGRSAQGIRNRSGRHGAGAQCLPSITGIPPELLWQHQGSRGEGSCAEATLGWRRFGKRHSWRLWVGRGEGGVFPKL